MSTEALPTAQESAYPPLQRSLFPMLLLFLAANFYSIDKAIVGVLAEPIKADLGIDDIQMGLLMGLAYSLLSGICGLWLGSLIDARVRKNVLGWAIIVWSVSTALGGLAPNFEVFFVLRALVGLGEAAVAPAALSLIADMFPPARRGRAISAYLIGATIGTALSSVIPGYIVAADLHLSVPGFGELVPWRTAFLLCGLVGPVVGLLFFAVREPARRGQASACAEPSRAAEKLAYLWRQRRVVVPLFSGFCLYYVAFVGVSAWTAPLLMRTFALTLPEIANLLGLGLLIAGLGGYFLGGMVADSRLGAGRGGRILVMAALPVLALPAGLAGLAPGLVPAIVCLAAISLATPMLNVAMNATVQEIAPNDMRGFSYALLSVVAALPAGAGGPFLIAFVSQTVLGDEARIAASFVIVVLPALALASLCFLLAWRAYARAEPDSELARVIRASHA
ncbi:MFS transporter [Novosphingobium mangrovi (ex Hu et al. 2023)]|uniref:MFS transporter n=1 Tax=Novosphingobium mangrovi (ex Hu et al. 2023) TaxID=2930094 RepID=A0ABT0AES5_9SPHN|nr:MFS transporter [Novosphingobium mangrovi (ex Hu et al. 2023)]MCJ1961686.1 MFS transporter [Novosphingobium mangrovi (ex Hu et al. 2023)]